MADARTTDLLTAMDHMLTSWKSWRDDSTLKDVTDALEEAITGCLTVWDQGTVPGDLRRLLPGFAELKTEWNRWVEQHDVAPTRHPIPGRAFWAVLEQIELAQVTVKNPKVFTLESIAKLDAMNPVPSDGQICRMYGFTDDGTPSGNPILTMLYEERATPGKHTGPGTGWMPPHARRQQAIEAQQRAAIEKMQRAAQSKVSHLTTPAKETIDELVALGCSGKQICGMKKFTRSDLAAYCHEHGLTEPQWEPAAGNTLTGSFDRPAPEYVPNAGGVIERPSPAESATGVAVDDLGAMTLEQQIIMYHQSGMEPAEIAAKVSEPDAAVSYQKVNSVVARWKADPAAFDMAGV